MATSRRRRNRGTYGLRYDYLDSGDFADPGPSSASEHGLKRNCTRSASSFVVPLKRQRVEGEDSSISSSRPTLLTPRSANGRGPVDSPRTELTPMQRLLSTPIPNTPIPNTATFEGPFNQVTIPAYRHHPMLRHNVISALAAEHQQVADATDLSRELGIQQQDVSLDTETEEPRQAEEDVNASGVKEEGEQAALETENTQRAELRQERERAVGDALVKHREEEAEKKLLKQRQKEQREEAECQREQQEKRQLQKKLRQRERRQASEVRVKQEDDPAAAREILHAQEIERQQKKHEASVHQAEQEVARAQKNLREFYMRTQEHDEALKAELATAKANVDKIRAEMDRRAGVEKAVHERELAEREQQVLTARQAFLDEQARRAQLEENLRQVFLQAQEEVAQQAEVLHRMRAEYLALTQAYEQPGYSNSTYYPYYPHRQYQPEVHHDIPVRDSPTWIPEDISMASIQDDDVMREATFRLGRDVSMASILDDDEVARGTFNFERDFTMASIPPSPPRSPSPITQYPPLRDPPSNIRRDFTMASIPPSPQHSPSPIGQCLPPPPAPLHPSTSADRDWYWSGEMGAAGVQLKFKVEGKISRK